MAKGFTFEIKGLKELQKKFDRLPNEMRAEISGELETFAQKVTDEAKKAAPTNLGTLKSEIVFALKDLNLEIRAGTKYAHIVEFGSKGKVKVPAEFSAYASTFKGQPSGGTFKQFVADLEKWVKRKGIGTGKNSKSVAYAIAVSIIKNGVEPKPYFFPAFVRNRPILLRNIKSYLKRALDK